jgi:hypothetical protein
MIRLLFLHDINCLTIGLSRNKSNRPKWVLWSGKRLASPGARSVQWSFEPNGTYVQSFSWQKEVLTIYKGCLGSIDRCLFILHSGLLNYIFRDPMLNIRPEECQKYPVRCSICPTASELISYQVIISAEIHFANKVNAKCIALDFLISDILRALRFLIFSSTL